MIPVGCNGQACPLDNDPVHEHDDGVCMYCPECDRMVVRFCDDAFRDPKPREKRRPYTPIQERS